MEAVKKSILAKACNPIILGAIGITLSYMLTAFYFEKADIITFMQAIRAVVAIAVTLAYFPGAIGLVWTGKGNRSDYLILGIVCNWASDIGVGIWTTISRFYGRPEWMLDNKWLSFFLLIAVIGGVLHLTAPGAVGGKVPRRNWMVLGAVLALATGVGFLGLWIEARVREKANGAPACERAVIKMVPCDKTSVR